MTYNIRTIQWDSMFELNIDKYALGDMKTNFIDYVRSVRGDYSAIFSYIMKPPDFFKEVP